MAATVTMDRAGRLVVPRAVRERFGLTGGPYQMELVEAPEGIVLRPVGVDVSVTRDASGWVVFHSDADDAPPGSIDPIAAVETERERRGRQVSNE
jgi:AbrB family looped-hinge helix DNA binding protein